MAVTSYALQQAVRSLGLSGKPVCVHSSLRSFGPVQGGAPTIIDAFLREGCTVLVPTFSSFSFATAPPDDPSLRFKRNAMSYDGPPPVYYRENRKRIYSPEMNDIERWMGIIPKTVLDRPDRIRGNNPLNSFAAVGPLAQELIAGQSYVDVYAPLRMLKERQGWILLMGVGLTNMTFLHYAEQEAGRVLFRRWANGLDGKSIPVAVGSCSRGFGHFEPVLSSVKKQEMVGKSLWQAFPAQETAEYATRAIQENTLITRCSYEDCERCKDSIAGGPLLS